MLSSYKDTFGYKFCDCTAVNQLIELLQNSEVQSFLKTFIDSAIATSELNILKRITAIEEKLGIIESEAPTIPQKLTEIEIRMKQHINCDFKPAVEPEIKPGTQTEERAVELIAELKTTDKGYLSTREIIHFLKRKVPNVKNIWKVKKDVLTTAQEMFPDTISLNKRDRGRKEVRLILVS